MNPTIKLVIGATVAIILFVAVSLVGLASQRSATDGSTNPNTQPNLNAVQEDGFAAVITYTGTGFEPNYHEVTAQNQIRVRNRSTRVLEFVSSPVTTHTDNQELNVGTINPGESRTFFVTQPGYWDYHNALDPSEAGSLVVF